MNNSVIQRCRGNVLSTTYENQPWIPPYYPAPRIDVPQDISHARPWYVVVEGVAGPYGPSPAVPGAFTTTSASSWARHGTRESHGLRPAYFRFLRVGPRESASVLQAPLDTGLRGVKTRPRVVDCRGESGAGRSSQSPTACPTRPGGRSTPPLRRSRQAPGTNGRPGPGCVLRASSAPWHRATRWRARGAVAALPNSSLAPSPFPAKLSPLAPIKFPIKLRRPARAE